MPYKLYLDDERNPKLLHKNWKIIRSFDEFVIMIQMFGLPNEMSLDHDLGENSKSGYDCIKWLVDNKYDLRGIIINIHSANPVGKENMQKLIDNYNKFLFEFSESVGVYESKCYIRNDTNINNNPCILMVMVIKSKYKDYYQVVSELYDPKDVLPHEINYMLNPPPKFTIENGIRHEYFIDHYVEPRTYYTKEEIKHRFNINIDF